MLPRQPLHEADRFLLHSFSMLKSYCVQLKISWDRKCFFFDQEQTFRLLEAVCALPNILNL